MLATGVALTAAAQLAGAAPERQGGIFRVGSPGASVQVDPQLAYITTAWWLEYATAAKLYNYRPNGTLVPEVASRYTVSNNGRRYTFFIRKGFRFSDGAPVTARSFKYALNRVANRDLGSPGVQFITDPNGVDIVGVRAVNDGRATDVSGVRARGNKLVIDLTDRAPKFLSVLTMPFFQATSTKLPLNREVADVRSRDDLPSAGPYAITLNDVNRTTSVRRNPFWRHGPGRTAPRNLDGVDLLWNLDERAAFEMVESGQLDEGPIPASEVADVAARYGVNKTRFWVKATNCSSWILFNSRAGLFQGNAAMRRAVNWALDRTDYVANAAPYAQTPWTHLLGPSTPGSITRRALQPYSVRSNIPKARQIAAGHYKDGRAIVAYRTNSPRVEVVRRDLTNLGLTVHLVPMFGGDIPPEWDLMLGGGWCYDIPDPSDLLLSPLNVYWPASPRYSLKIQRADALKGAARLKALGLLDLEITRNLAPVAAMHTFNNRFFFSGRVDPRSLSFHQVYMGWSIPSATLK